MLNQVTALGLKTDSGFSLFQVNMKSKIIISSAGLTLAICFFGTVQNHMLASKSKNLDGNFHRGQAAIFLVISLALGIHLLRHISMNFGKNSKS